MIAQLPNKVSIAGHTDAKGSDDYNQKLSERRAEAIKQFLSQKYNILAENLVTVGYGETQPVECLHPCHDPLGGVEEHVRRLARQADGDRLRDLGRRVDAGDVHRLGVGFANEVHDELAGIENIRVILSPLDFRKTSAPSHIQRPAWVEQLYDQIKAELGKLGRGGRP